MNNFIEKFDVDQNAGIAIQRDRINENYKIVENLDTMKNQSLYVFIQADNFVLPSDKFDLNTINEIMSNALSKIMLTKNKTVRFLKARLPSSEINIERLEALKLDYQH